jgi:hypothetical protein
VCQTAFLTEDFQNAKRQFQSADEAVGGDRGLIVLA